MKKSILIILAITLSTLAISCSKSSSDDSVGEVVFSNAYNGTYTGTIVESGSGIQFTGNVTLSVSSATNATLTGDAGNVLISNIVNTGGTTYSGTKNGGGTITLSFSGTNNSTVTIGGSVVFNGTK